MKKPLPASHRRKRVSEIREKLVQGSLDEEIKKVNVGSQTPTGLPMEKPDQTDYDLRRGIQVEQFQQRLEELGTIVKKPRRSRTFFHPIDASEGMRDANNRARKR